MKEEIIRFFNFSALDLQSKSSNAEIAVIELIHKFLDSIPSKQIKDLKDKWYDFQSIIDISGED